MTESTKQRTERLMSMSAAQLVMHCQDMTIEIEAHKRDKDLLAAEIAEMREHLEILEDIHRQTVESGIAGFEAMKERLEASEKDATRLDYLSSEMNRTVHYLTGKWYWSRKPYKTYMRKESIREAIDAAMKEQDK